jgi:hypothetical protein
MVEREKVSAASRQNSTEISAESHQIIASAGGDAKKFFVGPERMKIFLLLPEWNRKYHFSDENIFCCSVRCRNFCN